ncbi:uncharacterized protein [Lepeophtheirus salmonis]|uniref:uncharacterized protein isoform X3 n=2 Tax=Lepeophtheirus salmonis TaxID=72036 RepID=UPI001AE9AAED|nr:uncharacterized protein LOC121118716 isoform X3 [Lepeophtheirus salmonis]
MMDPWNFYNSIQPTTAPMEDPSRSSSRASFSSTSSFHTNTNVAATDSSRTFLFANQQIRFKHEIQDVMNTEAKSLQDMPLSSTLSLKDTVIAPERKKNSIFYPVKDASYHPATVSATSAAQLLLANHEMSRPLLDSKLNPEGSKDLLELKSSHSLPLLHGSHPYLEGTGSSLFQGYSGFEIQGYNSSQIPLVSTASPSQIYYQSPSFPQHYGKRGEYPHPDHQKELSSLTRSSASRYSSQSLSSITSTLAHPNGKHKQSTPNTVLPRPFQKTYAQQEAHIYGHQRGPAMSALDSNSSGNIYMLEGSSKLLDYPSNYNHSKLKRIENVSKRENTYKGSESKNLGSSDTCSSRLFPKGNSTPMSGVLDTLKTVNSPTKAILTFDIDNSGYVPQIVMHPWDNSSASDSGITLTPSENAVPNAYSQQWPNITAIPSCGGDDGHTSMSDPSSVLCTKTQEYKNYCQRVISKPPDDEMGFLVDLPPSCNVILQPSSIGLSGKIPDSPFQIAFLKFLKGEHQSNSEQITTPDHESVAQLPGKKAYVPPYTPKSKNISSAYLYMRKDELLNPNEELPIIVDTSQIIPTSNNNNSSNNINNNLVPKPPSTKKKKKRGKSLDRETQHHPTRGTKARRAKDISFSKRLIQEKILLDENEEGMELGVSESDEDVSWTPYSDKNGKRGKRMSFEHEGGNSSSYSYKIKKQRGNDFIESSMFREGDFLMLKGDFDQKIPPIFRVSPKKSIERYSPERKDDYDNWMYRSTGSFIELELEDMYNTIVVECIHDGKLDVVKVIYRPRGPSDPELHKRSIGETSKFQDNFEVFMQALLSQSLDANFLNEVYTENDDYFVSNIQKIDSVTSSRKDKITSGVRVTSRFLTGIMTWPCFNDLGSSAVGDVRCGSCEVEPAKTMIQMFGQPYNQNSLNPVLPKEEARLHRNFSICNSCSRLASLYHRLSHNKQKMFQVCSKLVEVNSRSNPNKDTTLLLNELLANDDWLDQQFNKIQELWAEADSFIR